MKMRNWLAIGVVVMAGAASSGASAAVNAYLTIDGIQGEAMAPHAGWIEIQSFSLVAAGPVRAAGGGSATGKIQGPSSMNFAMYSNKATPKLMQANAKGQHFPSAKLEVFKAGGAAPYMRYKMTEVMVSSFNAGGQGGGGQVPIDRFSLNFATVDVETLELPAGGPSYKVGDKKVAGEAPPPPPPPPHPPAGSGAASAVQAGGLVAALPGTITAVKVQPAAVDSGGTVTMTVEGTGECKFAWLDFGDKSQAQAQPFGSPFPKAFSHVFSSPGTFTVIAWGYDPDSPQKAAPKAGTCIGKKTATVQVRSLMMVAPAIKK